MLKVFTKKSKGFTLIELLVVIAIIGILASIVLVSMTSARDKARDAVRKADMRQIISAQEIYYGDNDFSYLDLVGPAMPTAIGTGMLSVPTDPGGTAYIWVTNTADDQTFCIYATLSDGSFYTASERGNFPATGAADCTVTPLITNCCFP